MEQSAQRGGQDDYWQASSRPLVSLQFVAPLLATYEAGVLLLGAAAARNGADAWLRQLLDLAGFGQYFLLPVLTVSLLLGWHHARRDRWQWKGHVVPRMWLESAAWAAGMLAAVHLLVWFNADNSRAAVAAVSGGAAPPLGARLVGYLGAGLYEELLFRLLLVPPLLAVLRRWRFERRARMTFAATISGLLFAAAHYQIDAHVLGWHLVWPHGEAFAPLSFLLRLFIGAALAGLYVQRGFGIAVGAHALYDLLLLVL